MLLGGLEDPPPPPFLACHNYSLTLDPQHVAFWLG